jgi:hypothetical protein
MVAYTRKYRLFQSAVYMVDAHDLIDWKMNEIDCWQEL